MRLDHLLSKEYMLVVRTWYERTNVHSRSTTDEANRSGIPRPNRLVGLRILAGHVSRVRCAAPIIGGLSMTLQVTLKPMELHCLALRERPRGFDSFLPALRPR